MNLRHALALAIKTARKTRRLTQEDFGIVSSRTYVSTLERGLKSPTIDKLDDIGQTLKMHPASVILAAYVLHAGPENEKATVDRILEESRDLIAKLLADQAIEGRKRPPPP